MSEQPLNEAKDETPDSKDRLSSRAKSVIVGAATLISLGFGITTQFWLLPHSPKPGIAFWVMAGIGTLMPLIAVSIISIWPEMRVGLFHGTPENHNRGYEKVWLGALFVETFVCISVLGWFTRYTGGTLVSPYTQALVAIVVLSPAVAKRNRTVFVVALFAAVIVFLFAGNALIHVSRPASVPPFLAAVSLLANACVGLALPVSVNYFETRNTKN